MTNWNANVVLAAVAVLWLGGCASTDVGPAVDLKATDAEEVKVLPEWETLWDFSDPAGSAGRLQDAMVLGKRAGAQEYAAIVATQLARTQGMQRKFDEAHALLDGVEDNLAGASMELRMRYLLERGRVLNSSGKSPESSELFEAAWVLGQGADVDHLVADAGHMLAIVAEDKDALVWAETTMQFCEESLDTRCRGWLGPLYNNTGWTYFEAGDLEAALGLWKQGLDFRVREGEAESISISRWTIARCFREMGRIEAALAEQLSLAADRESWGAPSDGYVSEEIAECLFALGRSEEARPWFGKAFEELGGDTWLQAEEPERLSRLERLAAE